MTENQYENSNSSGKILTFLFRQTHSFVRTSDPRTFDPLTLPTERQLARFCINSAYFDNQKNRTKTYKRRWRQGVGVQQWVSMALAWDIEGTADILRDIINNPFYPPLRVETSWLTQDVVTLAKAAYSHLENNYLLDDTRLLILADALEETNCDDDNVLFHLRGIVGCNKCQGVGRRERPGPAIKWDVCKKCKGEGLVKATRHVKGCHIVEAILQQAGALYE